MRTRTRNVTAATSRPRGDRDLDRSRLVPGIYLTDGTWLFNVLGPLPEEPALMTLEDCATLDILVVRVEDLLAASVRAVQPCLSVAAAKGSSACAVA